MRRGLIISSALHLLILFWAVAVFPSASSKTPPKPTPLPVDLISQAEFTKIKAGQSTVAGSECHAWRKTRSASSKKR